jgi:hypothetical protein
METPRFLVQKKNLESLGRINPSLDVLVLDPRKMDMLYLVQKWLPRDFVRGVRRLAMTFEQLQQRSIYAAHGHCLHQFTGLKELIVFIQPGFENIWERAHLSQRDLVLANKGKIKRLVMRLVNNHLNRMIDVRPERSEWHRPVLKVFLDERSLKKKLKKEAC